MVFQRLRETLYFFWHHLTPLLGRLLPLLPLLVFANYRLLVVHGGDQEQAMQDLPLLACELLGSLSAMAVTLRFTLAEVGKAGLGPVALWQRALASLPTLAAVQILSGLLVSAGPLLMFVPGLQLLGLLLVIPSLWLLGVLMPACVIAVEEKPGVFAALRAAWARFRPTAWELAASLFALMLGLVIVMSGLDALGRLLVAAPMPLRLAAVSGLELVGLLFSQMVAILLVRFYEIERQAPTKAGWN